MDWTSGGLDEVVSFTESHLQFVKSHYSSQEPFNPVTDLPEYKLNRIDEWENSSSAVATPSPWVSTQLIHRHPCEVLAEHWDEVFKDYRFASHLFNGHVDSISRSSACAFCRLLAQSPMIADIEESRPSHFSVYTVNLLGERERLAANIYLPEDYVIGLTVSMGHHRRPEKHLKGLSRRNHRHGSQGLLVPAIKRDDEHGHCSPCIARVIDTNKTDFSLLQRWINKCKISVLLLYFPSFWRVLRTSAA
ncbi:hypothetical protein RRF57_005412 [Xylaria bambusicola]|uniref:Uncharacterized protein n=1 Tax=Xylaria bambusicola TaxID=326684 RepID=A0AAN7UJU1_9PEZI